MPSKSKTKGNKFELDMVKHFNRIYQTEEFHRTPNSGAIMGRSNWQKNEGLSNNTKSTLGSDIIVPDDFNFSVECKHYKTQPNHAKIIHENDSKLDEWIGETVFDARNLNKLPLLIFKTNNKGIFFVLPKLFIQLDTISFSHYLIYNEFVIIGMDQFENNAEYIKQYGNDISVKQYISEWMKQSEYINTLTEGIT